MDRGRLEPWCVSRVGIIAGLMFAEKATMLKEQTNFVDDYLEHASGLALQVCRGAWLRTTSVRPLANRTLRRIRLSRCPVGFLP